jgi:hypothetical protein
MNGNLEEIRNFPKNKLHFSRKITTILIFQGKKLHFQKKRDPFPRKIGTFEVKHSFFQEKLLLPMNN